MSESAARYLPLGMQEIADAIGVPAALALIQAFGGVGLYVPKRFDPEHGLCALIGPAALIKLIEIRGGEAVEIPRALASARAERDACMRRDRSMGASQRELALRYQMTERHVRNRLQREEEDDNQIGLF